MKAQPDHVHGGADSARSTPARLSLAPRQPAAGSTEVGWEMVWGSAAAGMALVDLTMRFAKVKPALGRLLGADPGDLLGCHIVELMHPDEVECNIAVLRSVVSEGASARMERRYRRPDGTYVWVDVSVSPVRDEAGDIRQYFVQVMGNVDGRRRAEASLSERMKELTCMFGVCRDGLADLPLAELASRAGGHLVAAMQHPTIATASVVVDGVAMADETIAEPTGASIVADITVGGNVRGHVRVSYAAGYEFALPEERDLISAVAESLSQSVRRREADEALRQSNESLRALFDASPVAFLAADTEQRVTMWTRAAERMFGWTEEEMLGKHMPFFDRRSPAQRRLAELILEGVGFAGIEATRARKDGTPIELSISAAPVRDGDGTITGIIAVDVDITERKRLEAEVVRALEEAQQTSRLKSQFMATTSHELRTPLAVIVGMSELLLDTDLSDAQRPLAEAVERAGTTLSSIVEDILDFSNVANGRIDLEMGEVELRPFVEEVRRLLESKARAKGLEIGAVCDPDVPDVVCADPVRLRQVMTILVSNAVKFTERGRVVIHASCPESAEALRVRITVVDTGIGIAPADLWRVFHPFWQADGSDTRRHGGIGIGLSLAAELVEAMGGTVGVQSTPGRGSTFWFDIPTHACP